MPAPRVGSVSVRRSQPHRRATPLLNYEVGYWLPPIHAIQKITDDCVQPPLPFTLSPLAVSDEGDEANTSSIVATNSLVQARPDSSVPVTLIHNSSTPLTSPSINTDTPTSTIALPLQPSLHDLIPVYAACEDVDQFEYRGSQFSLYRSSRLVHLPAIPLQRQPHIHTLHTHHCTAHTQHTSIHQLAPLAKRFIHSLLTCTPAPARKPNTSAVLRDV